MEDIEYRRSGVDAMDVHFRLGTDAGSGSFDGYLSLWNRLDSYDTFQVQRSFSRGGLGQAYNLQDMHSVESYTRDTLGMFKPAEDDLGLVIERGTFAPTRAGQDARALGHLAQEYGQPAELSIGFVRLMTADQDPEVEIDDRRGISVSRLKESSMIIPHFASLAGAEMSSVRSQGITTQADVLRAITDTDDLLEPRAEARIIDLMTDRNGRKRSLVVRVGFEAQDDEERAKKKLTDADAPTKEECENCPDLTDEHLTDEPIPETKAERVDKPNGKNAEQLKNYWTKGEGLAKWADKPHPWSALYKHLLKYIKVPAIAKATAAKWFHEVKGYYPGDKKNHAADVELEARATAKCTSCAKFITHPLCGRCIEAKSNKEDERMSEISTEGTEAQEAEPQDPQVEETEAGEEVPAEVDPEAASETEPGEGEAESAEGETVPAEEESPEEDNDTEADDANERGATEERELRLRLQRARLKLANA